MLPQQSSDCALHIALPLVKLRGYARPGRSCINRVYILVIRTTGHTQSTNVGHDVCRYVNASLTMASVIKLAPNNNEQGGKSDKEKQNATQEPRYFHLTIAEWVQDGIAFLLAVITAIYVGITSRMAGKIRSQAGTMERQLVAMKEQLYEMKAAREQTIEQMRNAGAQTGDLIRQGAAQVAALNVASDIALETALAAKLNADSAAKTAAAIEAMNQRIAQIEGGKIIATVEWLPGVGKITHLDGGRTGLHIAIRSTNEGKSIAWIRQIRLAAGIFHNTIPSNPDFDNIEIIFNGMEAVPSTQFFKRDETPVIEGRDGIGEWILIWGIVEYSDNFSGARETTFGYIVRPDTRLERLTDPAYNKHS